MWCNMFVTDVINYIKTHYEATDLHNGRKKRNLSVLLIWPQISFFSRALVGGLWCGFGWWMKLEQTSNLYKSWIKISWAIVVIHYYIFPSWNGLLMNLQLIAFNRLKSIIWCLHFTNTLRRLREGEWEEKLKSLKMCNSLKSSLQSNICIPMHKSKFITERCFHSTWK